MDNQDKIFRRKKILGYFLLLFLVISIVSPVFFYPREAKALVSFTTIIKDIPGSIEKAYNKIKDKLKAALKVAQDVAVKNSLRVFFGKIAEDTAVWLASAGTGQKPLFITDPHYWSNLRDAALGDYIATIGDEAFGYDVCDPTLTTKLAISMSLGKIFNPSTYCQDNCQRTYGESKSEIENGVLGTAIKQYSSYDNVVNVFGADRFQCPVQCTAPDNSACTMGQPSCNCIYAGDGGQGAMLLTSKENVQLCYETLKSTYAKEVSAIETDKTTCLKNCKAGRRKEQCTFSKIVDNYDAYRDYLSKTFGGKQKFSDLYSNAVALYLEPEQNDIGQLLTIYGLAEERAMSAKEKEETKYNPSISAMTSKVSGETLTPPALTTERAKSAVNQGTKAEEINTGSWKADVIQVFTNTLIDRLTKRFFAGKCGLNPSAAGCKGPSGGSKLSQLVFGGGPSGIAAAKLQFSSIGKINYISGNPGNNQIDTGELASLGLIDSRFQTAIDQKITVKEALDQGLLDGNAPFGFTTSGNEPETGYPYRTIQYLRKYRIVPVGWELAAKYIKNFKEVGQNLNTLVEAFDDCGQGGTTASPFCGLVDPNWVLKMPATYCRRMGSAEDIISKNAVCNDTSGDGKLDCSITGNDILEYDIQRNTETCVDELSCLQENDDGSCKGDAYGYCFEERNTWRFDGDACPRVYASCQSYNNRNNQTVSYLKNTVDTNGCSEANAGCGWYCKDYADNNWTCTNNSGSKIYFDRDVESCDATAEGCQEFIKTGSGVNLVPNGGFERYSGEVDNGAPDVIPGWNTADPRCSNNVEAVTDYYEGAVALKFSQLSACAEVNTGYSTLHRTFAVSFYAKATAACNTSFQVESGGIGYADLPISLTTSWQAFSSSFLVNDPASTDEILIKINSNGCNVIIDAVQLEEGSKPTPYKAYGTSNVIYMNKNRISCAEDEVGCELYTPKNGDPAIPGVVYADNLCLAENNGCKSFKEMPIKNVPERDGNPALYFIANSGKQCNAAYVGCEEYTNLDVVAQGGEGREYYSQIKQCVKPDDPDVATYYTWEGSDVTGFQLRAYHLKQSTLSGSDGERAPCTNLSVATTATNPVCTDTAANIVSSSCQLGDMVNNPDCTEYYDTGGHVFYRLKSRTITASDNCHPYRNTIDANQGNDYIYHLIPSENIKCPAAYAGCREYKGNTGTNVKTVLQEKFEGEVTAWQGAVKSSEATNPQGYSIKVDPLTYVQYNVTDLVSENNLYLISFWAKGPATNLDIYFSPDRTSQPIYFVQPPISIQGDWNLYTLGPAEFNRPENTSEYLTFYYTDGGPLYIDNVLMKEVRDNAYLIKDSYVSCLASEINCQEYKDRSGQKLYIKSFNKICQESKVGCRALINTQNSTNPFSENVKGVTILQDTAETWVVNSAHFCQAANKGCISLGKPTIQKDVVTSWDTVYLKNNPDNYSTILCESSENGCEEYKATDGTSVAWFKDPGDKTCEYKKLVGDDVEHWYQSGTTTSCPIDTPPPEGIPVENWVGLCPAEFSGCNEYRDPGDPDPCRTECGYQDDSAGNPLPLDIDCQPTTSSSDIPGCRSYFYLKQSVEDNITECGDTVNLEQGCRPFNDTSNPTLNFRGK